MKTTEELIAEIQAIRTRNNVNWMDILRLAFRAAPDEAREIYCRIIECDNEMKAADLELCKKNGQ